MRRGLAAAEHAAERTQQRAETEPEAAHRTRLREALGLWIERPEQAVIEEDVHLPADLRVAIQRSRRTRERAEWEQENAQEQTRAAAVALVDEGVSLRDAGELLGLSHQRVQQLVQAQ